MAPKNTIPALAQLEALEASFIDCYETAIAQISDPYVRQQLEECQRSHRMRVDILSEEIEDIGGQRDRSARDAVIAIGAGVIGELAAIARLLQLEDVGLTSYRQQVDAEEVSFDVRDLIGQDLIPEQERTHAIIAALKQEA
jgi:hypothetical protein